MFPFCRVEDSDLEDYDHEAAGERIGSMLDNLKRHPQIVAECFHSVCAEFLSIMSVLTLRCQDRIEIMETWPQTGHGHLCYT